MSNRDDLKFRVWNPTAQKYEVYEQCHYFLRDDGCRVILEDSQRWSDGITYEDLPYNEEIERCTGLKDHNEKLVYQNDRIHIEDPIPGVQEDVDLVVKWDKGGWVGQGKHGKYSLWAALTHRKVRVVGTIHDGEAHQ